MPTLAADTSYPTGGPCTDRNGAELDFRCHLSALLRGPRRNTTWCADAGAVAVAGDGLMPAGASLLTRTAGLLLGGHARRTQGGLCSRHRVCLHMPHTSEQGRGLQGGAERRACEKYRDALHGTRRWQGQSTCIATGDDPSRQHEFTAVKKFMAMAGDVAESTYAKVPEQSM